jgi:hypothetical protein
MGTIDPTAADAVVSDNLRRDPGAAVLPERPWMGPRVRTFVLASVVVWAVSGAIWATLLWGEHAAGCPDFDVSAGTSAESSQWQWLPIGEQCVYYVGGQTHVDDPPVARLAVLGLMIAWPVGTATLGMLAAHDREDALSQVVESRDP